MPPGGASPATAIVLTGASSGTTGIAATFTGTANGNLSAAMTFTPAADNGATVSPATVTLGPGTLSGTFTVTRATAGASSVSITNNAGLTTSGSPILYAASDPVAGGTWEQLTVASHPRRVLTLQGNGTISTFTPDKALAVEAQAAASVQAIPGRAFSLPVPGERGIVYLTGGLHSNYQGNEIDRMALPSGNEGTSITTTLSHQPNMPPEGKFSGYGSGNGGYIYRQYAPGLADPSDWQPYPGHQWTKNGWNPYWGFFSLTAHALQSSYPDGVYSVIGGVLQSSAAQPADDFGQQDEHYGVVAWDGTLPAKYKTFLSTTTLAWPQVMLGQSGVTDWNNWDQSILFFQTSRGVTYINRWNPVSGLTQLADTMMIGGFDASGSNGLLARWLEHRKYLILRQTGRGIAGTRLLLYSEDFGVGESRFKDLTPPALFSDCMTTNDVLTFCVDKNSRRVFWMIFPGPGIPIRIYVSTFADLMAWTQITVTPDLVVPDLQYTDSYLAANRQPMLFRDGYLFLIDNSSGAPNDPGYLNGGVNWKRVKVDGGEDLPAMNFRRYDYRLQDFTFSSDSALALGSVKHTNWAYRPGDNKHYLCAGDMGSSTCGSLATLQFDGTSRGYTFTETLNETALPPPGTFRPSSPDDGHFFHVPNTCPVVGMRDKFVWMRGGDGGPMFTNAYLRARYGAADANGTPQQVAAAIADGWDIAAKYYIFDPTTTTFPAKINGTGWTQDNGGISFADVWTAGSATSRNGAYDSTTNTLWRFYDTGSASLASFNFTTQQVKFYNLSTWLSGETGRTIFTSGASPASLSNVIADGTKPGFCWFDAAAGRYVGPLGLNWEHKATWLDERDGKLYGVAPSTGYLWCFETRGPVTSTADGYKLPFYPVGKRMALVGTFPALDNQYPPVPHGTPGSQTNGESRMSQFLVPYKGGLLWWGSAHIDSGTFGYPRFAFWRRLGYTGDWTVVSMPQEFCANTYSLVSKGIDNPEVVMLSGGGNANGTPGPWPFFWRLQ